MTLSASVIITLHKGRQKNGRLPPIAWQTKFNTVRWWGNKSEHPGAAKGSVPLLFWGCPHWPGQWVTQMGCLYSEGTTFKTFINVCTVKRHFCWYITFTKLSFTPKTLFTHAPIKTKAEGQKKSMLNDFQPCTVPSSTPMKLDEEKTPVSPFPIKASTSSQLLFKWKEKLCPLPYLNSHWKPPESILSKLMGLDGNSMPYCFGTVS